MSFRTERIECAPPGIQVVDPELNPLRMPHVYLKTFGCQMNEYDSARMADVLRESGGYELAETAEDADLLLLNTCSVREKAQEKVFSQLGRWRELKVRRPGLIIGVGGCVASQEGDGITERAPFVDLVFGPQTLHRLPAMIEERRRTGRAVVDVSFPEIEKFDRLPEPQARGATAFVSVTEGCSKYCTFCVVPYTRGEEVSRPLDQVLDELKRLAAQGVSEVTLLGQNVNAYRGTMTGGGHADLAALIYFVAELPGIERIRFTTSHPVEFRDDLVEAFRDVPKLANYLHLPVQSGSDRILALMKRGHTVLEYRQKLRRLRDVRPDISLSSDFIVGYPGETERDFEATLALIAEVGFDQAFSFIYSRRPGTPAASLPDDVTYDEKQRRLERLQALVDEQSARYARAMVGSRQRVLVERPSRRDARQLAGRTSSNRWVNFDGPATLIDRYVEVEITAALPNSLRGRLVEAQRSVA
jgi:tRNA-2-methylthio-N6-dimethylallyladenosine synthase